MQASSQGGRLWSNPSQLLPTLIALALESSAPCGLNVQLDLQFPRYVPKGALWRRRGRGQGLL